MKPKLLLLHGALGSKKQFAPVAKLLKQEFDIYSLTFEGHGGIESEKDFSIQLFSDNVLAYLDQKGLDSIYIFGYSMGGYVALNLALQNPERIIGIATLGTKFNWSPESAAKEVKMLDADKIEEKVPRFADKLRNEHHPLDWKIVVRKTAKMMLEMGDGNCLKPEDFQKIPTQVMIGIGSLDSMVSQEESENVANLLPNGKLTVLEEVPHPIDLVDPIKLAEYIRNSIK